MSERERWIVYPLLFLALGAALRDKLFDMTTSKRIVCQELTVVDEEPVGLRPARVLARIGRAEGLPATTPPMGLLIVEGQVEVNGAVVAQRYAMRGLPYGILSFSLNELWQAFQQNLQNTNPSGSQPPQGKPAEKAVPATDAKAPSERSANEPSQ